jgi:hypothetical protein
MDSQIIWLTSWKNPTVAKGVIDASYKGTQITSMVRYGSAGWLRPRRVKTARWLSMEGLGRR